MATLYALRLGQDGPPGSMPWQVMDERRQSPGGIEYHLANELRDAWRVPRPCEDVKLSLIHI
eukprot:1449328-Lingulodinium_polyedra.AAC.1